MTLAGLALGATSSAAGAMASGAAAAPPTDVASVPAALQGVMSATFGADDPAYRVAADGARYRVDNVRQGFAATMGAEGLAIRKGDAEWRLRLTGWGRGEARKRLATGATTSSANRLEVKRGDVTEWWVNGPLGLEQGWTIGAAPGGDGRGPLTLVLEQSGGLHATAGADKITLAIADRSGRTLLRYAGLAAYDSTGRELPAGFEVSNASIRVRVDDAGAAYPVRIDPWVQAAELTASDGATGDSLGYSVAVSADGSTVVAGAYSRNSSQGAAYVFFKPVSGWANGTQTAELTASDGVAGDKLGYSVAVSGDGSTVVAGAWAHNSVHGAAYVFVKPVSGWVNGTQTAELTAPLVYVNYLGFSVAVSGDGSTVVAGAYGTDIGLNISQGAAYVFVEPVSGWANGNQTAELTSSLGVAGYSLGYSVAVNDDGSTVVAGEPYGAASAVNQGRAAVFVRPGSGWASETQAAELTASNPATNDELGWSVAVSGDGSTVVAGTRNINSSRGAAYVFVKPGTGWYGNPIWGTAENETAELTASDGVANDGLGTSVAVSDNGATVVAGAPGHNSRQGAAYVFVTSDQWAHQTQADEPTASDGAANDSLGTSVAVSGNGSTVVAGASGRNSGKGAAYVFQTSSLVFTMAPSGTGTAGFPWVQQPVVTMEDPSGNTVTSWATGVTLAINSGAGTLTCSSNPVTPVSGVATFSGCSLDPAGTYTLQAMSGTIADSATHPSITISPSGSITGHVTNSVSSAPIGGATVTLSAGGGSTTTDGTGLYSLTAIPATYDVTASALGYTSSTASGEVITGGSTTTADFALTPSTSSLVSGYVVDNGHGWPMYAQISAAPGGSSTWTDPFTGYYAIHLPDRVAYTLTASSFLPGYNPANGTVDLTTPGDQSKNFQLIYSSCSTPGYRPPSLLWSENFDSVSAPALPAGWETVALPNQSGETPYWYTTTSTSPSGAPPHSPPNMATVSGASIGPQTRLDRTVDLDLSATTSPTLYFWIYHDTVNCAIYSGAKVQPQVSTDGGTTWNNVGSAVDICTGSGWMQYSADLSAYKVATARIGFLHTSDDENNPYLDDVSVYDAAVCAAVPGGIVGGFITDANTGSPINGASIADDRGESATSVPTPGDPAQPGGLYELFVALPDQQLDRTFTASFPGYNGARATFPPAPNTVTRHDFALSTGPASKLVFVQQPTGAMAGQHITPAVTVQLEDSFGNLVSSSGVAVGMTLSSGNGSLSGTASQLTDGSGLATFGDLFINLIGSKQLTASRIGLTSAISTSFNITAGAAMGLTATAGTPQSAAVNAQFAQPLEVTVTDDFGNPVSGVIVTFTAPASGPSATLSNGGSATTDANGHASVTATANHIAGGPYLVTADPPTLTPVTFSLTNDPGEAIPLLGGVGLVVLALLVLAGGALALARWRLGG